MTTKKPGRNEPCHCGSGRKYKKCHESVDQGRFPFRVPGKPNLMITDLKVEASLVDAEASPLPGALLRLARHAAATAQSDRDTLIALLLVTTAGEALANRLLEPLMPSDEWGKFERSSVAKKWKRLHEAVGASALEENKPPLSSYLAVTELRNDLVHFKHGRNVWQRAQPLEVSWDKGTVRVGGPIADATERAPATDWRQALASTSAPGYFEALRDLLLPVLERHPDDEFRFVDDLKTALKEPLPSL